MVETTDIKALTDASADASTEIATFSDALDGISERMRAAVDSVSAQTAEIKNATTATQRLETLRNDAIKAENFQRALSISAMIEEYESVITANADLAAMMQQSAAMQERDAKAQSDAIKKADEEHQKRQQEIADNAEAISVQAMQDASDLSDAKREESYQVFALGNDQAILGKATRLLDDKFNTLKDSSGLLGDMFEGMSDSGRKMALSFSVSAGMLGTVAHKYASSLLESATFLPDAIRGAGLVESSVFMGTMMAKTGLGLDELSGQMKNNRVAWQSNGEQIANFISDNEGLRLKLGETREGFVEMAARATNFLSNRGVEQKDLAAETEKYLINLEQLAVQSGRQASEVEAARRDAKKDKGAFLLQFGGAARTAMNDMVSTLTDQIGNKNGIAEEFSRVLGESNVQDRLKGLNDSMQAMRNLGLRAGVSSEKLNELFNAQQQVVLGNADFADDATRLSDEVNRSIVTFGKTNALVDKNLGRAFNDAESRILATTMEAITGDDKGAVQSELDKAAISTAKTLEKSFVTPGGDILTTLSRFSGMLGAVGGDITTTLLGFGSALPGFIEVGKQIPAMGGAMKRFALGVDKSGKKSGGAITKFLGFLGPIGMAIGAIAIIAPLIVQHWDTIVEYLKSAGEIFGKVFDVVVDTFKDMFPNASAFLSEWIVTPVKGFFGEIFGGEKSGNFFQDWIVTPLTRVFDSAFGGVTVDSLFQDWIVTPLTNVFDHIFGGEKTGNFFQDWIMNPVINLFSGLFAANQMATNLIGDYLISPLVNWLGSLFGFDLNFDLNAIIKEQIFDRFTSFIGTIGDFISGFASMDSLKKLLPSSIAQFLPDSPKESPKKEVVAPKKEYKSSIDDLITRKQRINDQINTGTLPEAALKSMTSTLAMIDASINKQLMADPSISLTPAQEQIVRPEAIKQQQQQPQPIPDQPKPAQQAPTPYTAPVLVDVNKMQNQLDTTSTRMAELKQRNEAAPLSSADQTEFDALQVESKSLEQSLASIRVNAPDQIGVASDPIAIQQVPPLAVDQPSPIAVAEPIVNKQMEAIQRIESDLAKPNDRVAALTEKSKTTALSGIEYSELADARLDRVALEAILRQLKELNGITRTSVAIQDSINSKQARVARNS